MNEKKTNRIGHLFISLSPYDVKIKKTLKLLLISLYFDTISTSVTNISELSFDR